MTTKWKAQDTALLRRKMISGEVDPHLKPMEALDLLPNFSNKYNLQQFRGVFNHLKGELGVVAGAGEQGKVDC
jgi:hypothetical protein